MSVIEFKKSVSRCSFLFDWQKEQLMGMLDGVDDGVDAGVDAGVGDRDNGNSNDNGYSYNSRIYAEDVFPVLDNVLWRTMGVGLDSLPAMDRVAIKSAIRELTY